MEGKPEGNTVGGGRSLSFGPDGVGWLVNSKGDFLRSEDGGMTWKRPDNITAELAKCQWNSIDIGTEGFGVAVSESGCMAYTTDNGKNWKKVSDKISEHLQNVVIDKKAGLIKGENNIYTIHY